MEERTRIVEIVRGTPYKRPGELAEEFGCSRKTILNRMEEMEQEVDRYGKTMVIEDDKLYLINVYAFLDFMKYRKRLADKVTRKYVPEYDPMAWADACGYGKRIRIIQEQ